LIGPLEGLFVVDASTTGPGSIASMVLADYGARVVKVEPPAERARTQPLCRKAWDRNKWSLTLDLSSEAGRNDLDQLLDRADVFIENFGPAKAAALGIDPDAIAAAHPWLIHASLSAYGRGGPWSDRPGFEPLVAARFGVMAEQDGPEPGPHFLGHPSLHYSTGLLMVSGILAASHARRTTGRGQRVDASLLDGVLALSTMNWWWNETGVSYLARTGTDLGFGRSRIITDLFLCGDDEWLVIHTGGTGGFKRAMDIVGLGDRIREIPGLETTEPLDDDEYHAARVLFPKAFAARPRDEWIKLFHEADLAALPVLRPGEVLDDEQVQFDRTVVEVDDPDLGVLRQVGRCVTYELSEPLATEPAPAVGQHDARKAELLDALAVRSAPAERGATVEHPLRGIRVLDFSSYFAGPYGARLLSDLGADVIKIEALDGDLMRPLPDPFEGAQRGKRTIAVDLKDPAGLAAVHDLVRTADVVMHNFRPGKAEKAGIGYEQLRALDNRTAGELIYCYLPGFGSAGPKSELKSFAPLLSGFVGNFYEGAGDGQPPVRRVIGNEDYYNGLSGAAAVLMAIECRDRTGRGQKLESAQLRSALFAMTHNFVGDDGAIHRPFRLDAKQRGLDPLYRLYQTSDGWVCVAAVGSRAAAALRAALQLDDDLAGDALAAAIESKLGALSTDDAFARLDGAGVPCEIALDYPMMPELLWEEWLADTDRVLEQQHPKWGWIREIGVLFKLSDTPAERKGCGPMLGEHTVELLQEIGRTQEQIDDLLGRRVCIAWNGSGES
jgi:crotonobetainyl-CoA:carnitine CoA-transferase CaiB-like acyl-CoA transferase